MMEQYAQAKREIPDDALLFFRMGDFYELFFEDAVCAAKELDLTLTARDKGADPVPMAGVPHHAATSYIGRLVARGFSVAICDQMEDPKQARGIVKRAVTRLITPGTISDLEALDPAIASYLAIAQVVGGDLKDAADPEFSSARKHLVQVAMLDLLAGEVLYTECCISALGDELERMNVRELLYFGSPPPDLRSLINGGQVHGLASREIEADDLSEAAATASLTRRFGERAMARLVATPAGSGTTPVEPCLIERLIRFAENAQRRRLPHLMAPRRYCVRDSMVLDEISRRNLELLRTQRDGRRHGSLFWHLNQCRTAMGSRLLANWLLFPLRDLGSINRRLDVVEALAADRSRRGRLREVLEGVLDIERLVGRVAVGQINARELGALRQSLTALPKVAAALSGHESALGGRWQSADLLVDVAELLIGALREDLPAQGTTTGVFKTGFDPQLDELIEASEGGHQYILDLERREREETGISNIKVRYNRVFGYFIEVTRAHLSGVPEHYVRKQTLTNAERFITDELKEFEERVVRADGERAVLEAELFEQFVARLGTHTERFRSLSRLVAETDVFASFAVVADDWRYSRPELVAFNADEMAVAAAGRAQIELQASRHPVVERLRPDGAAFVPSDVRLSTDARRLMVITGPNMGGKSTVMRQTALIAIMAQCGSFVPARKARLTPFDRVFTRVGASDDLSRGVSTFMAEMNETAGILRDASPQSLVILDEIGRGTATADGIAIARAVAENLHDRCRGLTMFATHYHELTALAGSCAAVVNAKVAVSDRGGKVVFLRELVDGPSSSSYGIHVAELAGVPTAVVERAKQLVAKDSCDAHPPQQSRDSLAAAEDITACERASLVAKDALIDRLRCANTEAMTPLEALVLLDELQRHLPRL